MSNGRSIDRKSTAPFLLKVFYRTGSFHRPDSFSSQNSLQYLPVYTWEDCTLEELALDIAGSVPESLPSPSIGTRLVFQLVCPDLRSTGNHGDSGSRFVIKNLGSVVIGEGGPGAEVSGDPGSRADEKPRTLGEARFVVGDYVSCAILPPLSDGSVAPAFIALRNARAMGPGSREPPDRHDFPGNNGGYNSRDTREGLSGAYGGFPRGEWKRGEEVPRHGHHRPRGRGRY